MSGLFALQRGMLESAGPVRPPVTEQPYRYPQSSDFAAPGDAGPGAGGGGYNPRRDAPFPPPQPQHQQFVPSQQYPPVPVGAVPPPASSPPQLPPAAAGAREYEPIEPSAAGAPPRQWAPQYSSYFGQPPSTSGGGQPQPQQQGRMYAYQYPPPQQPEGRDVRGPYNEPVHTTAKPMGGGIGPGVPPGLFEPETVANAPRAVRMGFIRKVYGILTAQLVFSMGCIALCLYHDGVRTYVQTNPTLMWVAMAGTIVIALAMACVPGLYQSYPTNLVMLSLFTLLQGYLLGTITSFYDTTAVMQAVVATAAVTTGLSLYAMQTKRDLSKMGSFLFVALIILVMFGFLRLFFPSSPLVDTIYSAVGALIFSAYIVYDTWLIANVLGPDDYILAALKLYLDIINLFIFLLTLIGGRRR